MIETKRKRLKSPLLITNIKHPTPNKTQAPFTISIIIIILSKAEHDQKPQGPFSAPNKPPFKPNIKQCREMTKARCRKRIMQRPDGDISREEKAMIKLHWRKDWDGNTSRKTNIWSIFHQREEYCKKWLSDLPKWWVVARQIERRGNRRLEEGQTFRDLTCRSNYSGTDGECLGRGETFIVNVKEEHKGWYPFLIKF